MIEKHTNRADRLVDSETRPALSVVAPCYNEEAVIHELYRRVTEVCEASGLEYEFLLVDDCSSDRTREIIAELAERDPRVLGVILSRNYGHQLALTAGLHVCRGERTLILDADLQDPPELLSDMMALMDSGYDVVYGKRASRESESAFKKFTAHLFYRVLNRLTKIEIPSDTGDFRLISRRALNHLNSMPEHHRFVRGMVSWIGFRQTPIEYSRDARFAGTTKYPFRKMVAFALDAIVSFSTVPLRLSIYLGFICAAFGLFAMGWTAYSYLAGIAIQGWTTLMVVVLILGSGQLIALGVIGEYLGRLYLESKKRPLFIIESIACSEKERSPLEDSSEAKAISSG